MAGQMEFLEAVKELERLGETNDNQLRLQDIRDYFSDMDLERGQMDHICQYLQSKGIHIANWMPTAQNDIFDEEIKEAASKDPIDGKMVDLYLKEAALTQKLTPDKEIRLLERMAAGDDEARTALIEANLELAAALAGEFRGRGLAMSDLIQESNIGLMIAVDAYEAGEHGDFREFISEQIRMQIRDSISLYNETTRSGIRMANRVNELNDLATAFAGEYGREARPEELAEQMGISEEEVRELMKVSLDAVSILE